MEQKNGAVVRRLVGYGRFDGVETARVMARLYAAARLHVNFFQPSFKLKEKRREGAKVIKRYHVPATPYERALAHPKLSKAIKRAAARDLSESRSGGVAWRRSARHRRSSASGSAKRGLAAAAAPFSAQSTKVCAIARGYGKDKCRRGARYTSPAETALQETDTHALQARSALATIESWLATEPQITALAIVCRLAAIDPATFGEQQHSIVQRLLRALRRSAAQRVIVQAAAEGCENVAQPTGTVDGSGYAGPDPPTAPLSVPAFGVDLSAGVLPPPAW